MRHGEIRFIKLGRYEREKGWEVENTIIKETEKAIQIKSITQNRLGKYSISDWIPKSQILYQNEHYVAIPMWLARKKSIPSIAISIDGDLIALKNEIGINAMDCTPQELLKLIEMGRAKENHDISDPINLLPI